ncbi:hypothetical protein [Noviluteimonas gilva]|uniref:SnoaL-like domain-containing protein n=1 Tax=Noviluteimonas gilva TaxID=2682097 RepID=A0A7C9HVD4_9GAMM|nr:hypothetical protein [Lysobacter gilvus]MUV14358.1 hypothetical protein [Lysobacter gilvus]
MRTFALVLSLSLLTACASQPDAPAPDTPTAAEARDDRLDIAEQIFRSLLGKNEATDLANDKPAVLCLDGKHSPNDAFMARFKDVAPRVHRCADGKTGMLKGTRMPEFQLRKTNEPALQFVVSDIDIKSPTHATARAEYYEAALSAGGWTFELDKTAAGWVVTSRKMDWIS